MPTIEEINKNRKKSFKKREYRPYNEQGHKIERESAHLSPSNIIHDIEPALIRNWEYHDRPENELGDIENLAKEFLEMGQQVPCIVREISHNTYKYELIAGERRWRASQQANLKLKVLIRNLTDNEAALVQISENSNRTALSDYAKGMSYARLIHQGLLNQSDLVSKLNISKQQVSRLLSFDKIPSPIIEAIGDMSQVSSRTAEQIKQLSAKDDKYIEAICHFASQIREGKVGQAKLLQLTTSYFSKDNKHPTEKIYSDSGKHLYSWRTDNNMSPSIHFPKSVASLIRNTKTDKEDLSNKLKKVIEEFMMKIP